MIVIKRIIIIILISVSVFVLLFFSAVLAGGVIPSGKTDSASEAVIYLENNGRHIDIWLPAEICGYPHSGWLSFGWGDRDFYLSTPYADDLNIVVLLKALFLPSRAVLAVEYSKTRPSAADLIELAVSQSQAENAWNFIKTYFVSDVSAPTGDWDFKQVPSELVHQSYGDVVFFEAAGRYSLVFTCNNWTGRVLKSTGIRTGLWTPLTFGVYKKQLLKDAPLE
jgi:uncharacterized protein (TIGR02117 family)